VTTAAPETFATTEEVAAYLAKPPSWLYANAGPLGVPRYKIGNQYRYKLSEVAAWVQNVGR
jgi:predicted DNA-binding transcriptional regulator AlpA